MAMCGDETWKLIRMGICGLAHPYMDHGNKSGWLCVEMKHGS
jgi:hypothetical protein